MPPIVRSLSVAEAAVGVDRDLAMGRGVDDDGDKARLLGIEIIGQRGDGDGAVFRQGGAVVLGLRYANAQVTDGELTWV